jgi:hypothetical protein
MKSLWKPLQKLYHPIGYTHCLDLDLMTKRRGTTAHNGFIFEKINQNIKERKRSSGQFWTVALTGHGHWPIQPISQILKNSQPVHGI